MSGSTVAIHSYQPLMADILKSKISRSEILSVVAITTEHDIVMPIAKEKKPDIFVLDCGLKDRGIVTARRLLESDPKLKVVILTGIEDSEHAVIALDAGVAGYISTACKKFDAVTAIELVSSGQSFVSPHIAAWVISRMRTRADERQKALQRQLNHREEQIARLLVKGHTNRAIADRLGLSEKTIKHYMSTLMQKFDTRNRLELAMILPKNAEQPRPYQ